MNEDWEEADSGPCWRCGKAVPRRYYKLCINCAWVVDGIDKDREALTAAATHDEEKKS